MLEEVQMPPALLLGVVGLTARLTADRTTKPAAVWKIDQNGQTVLESVTLNLADPLRGLKP